MADGSYGMGGGPLEPKVIGWMWGFGFGALFGAIALAGALLWLGMNS